MAGDRFYRDQSVWRELQQFLPHRLQLTQATEPEEDFWQWRGHRVQLDRYRNVDARARVVLRPRRAPCPALWE